MVPNRTGETLDEAVDRLQARKDLLVDGAVTYRQATEQYGLGRTALFALVRDRVIPAIRVTPKKVLLPRRAIVQYLAERMTPAATV